MTAGLSDSLLGGIQLTVGIALIAVAVAGGYQNYQGDTCNEAFGTLAASNQARIDKVQARLDSVRSREAALQARIKTLDTPAKDTK